MSQKNLQVIYIYINVTTYFRVILLLIGILVSLQYLHGAHYLQCRCIFPDEILDFPCFISIPLTVLNERINRICSDPMECSVSFQRLPYFCLIGFVMSNFLVEHINAQGYNERLFLLQHYKS